MHNDGAIYSEDAEDRDDLAADIDVDLAGDVRKEYCSMGVAECLAGAPCRLTE